MRVGRRTRISNVIVAKAKVSTRTRKTRVEVSIETVLPSWDPDRKNREASRRRPCRSARSPAWRSEFRISNPSWSRPSTPPWCSCSVRPSTTRLLCLYLPFPSQRGTCSSRRRTTHKRRNFWRNLHGNRRNCCTTEPQTIVIFENPFLPADRIRGLRKSPI